MALSCWPALDMAYAAVDAIDFRAASAGGISGWRPVARRLISARRPCRSTTWLHPARPAPPAADPKTRRQQLYEIGGAKQVYGQATDQAQDLQTVGTKSSTSVTASMALARPHGWRPTSRATKYPLEVRQFKGGQSNPTYSAGHAGRALRPCTCAAGQVAGSRSTPSTAAPASFLALGRPCLGGPRLRPVHRRRRHRHDVHGHEVLKR